MLLSLSFIAYSYGLITITVGVVWFGRFYFSFSYSRSFFCRVSTVEMFFYVTDSDKITYEATDNSGLLRCTQKDLVK